MRNILKSATLRVAVVIALLGAVAREAGAFTLPISIWSQNDPRWANDQMGQNGPTIGRAGCMMTCVAAALRTTPKQLNAYLSAKGGYAPGGLLIHQVAAAFDGPGGLQFVPLCGNFPANAAAVNLDISRGRCWIVYSRRFAPWGLDHWVLVFSSNGFQCQYMDPAYGSRRWDRPLGC